MYRVIFYCPDRHIVYDGRMPIERGVGGGVTSRVRMAAALAKLGHDVTAVVNCPRPEVIDKVRYVPLGHSAELTGDVLIANTSGGAYDLSPLENRVLDVGLRIVWVSGTDRPGGLETIGANFIYPKSNFLNEIVRDQWGMARVRRFVAYNGFDEDLFLAAEKDPPRRDHHRMVYFSHPSKGLATSLGVLRVLRRTDRRFHLDVFGGESLWGGVPTAPLSDEAVRDFGLVGQGELARELLASGYSLILQSRQEPFGMVVTESQRAGLVVLASPVGAYPELVQHGRNGFLVPGDPQSEETWAEAASLILELRDRPDEEQKIRETARQVPWSAGLMARVWTEHWDWWFGRREPTQGESCRVCGGAVLRTIDGTHCLECGVYQAHQPVPEAGLSDG